MGSDPGAAPNNESSSPITDMQDRHRLEIENLTLASQPIRTIQLFFMGTLDYLKHSTACFLRKGERFTFITSLLLTIGFALLFVDGPHEKHVQEFRHYFSYVVWWVVLGVASSIGLGSGLHTFVLYLGPHIAFFTLKAVKCGRVDLKSAPYDTIQWNRGPSWLARNCSDLGPPLFHSATDSLVSVPLSSILPQIQMEAILWGIGTALGELPPYFLSRAASMSGERLDVVEELDTPPHPNERWVSRLIHRINHQLLSRAQHLNFFTVLLLASVPNPLFDLAGILCGKFGVPFWKFFLATLTGKAIIKTHIQTMFIISLCNNQLLEWVENEMIWMLGLFPGFNSNLPNLSLRLHQLKYKYMSMNHAPMSQERKWNLSFNLIWNSIVWMMLLSFFAKIVTSTAQGQLRKQQEKELNMLAAGQR